MVKEICMKKISEISFENDNIIITDPCYLKEFKKNDEWIKFNRKCKPMENEYAPRFYNDGVIFASDTLFGDWSCTVYNCTYKEFKNRCKRKQKIKKGDVLGKFCADAGMVCVFSEKNYSIEDDLGDWCYTRIPNFTGTVSFYAVDYDTLIIEGLGNINFCSVQTGF